MSRSSSPNDDVNGSRAMARFRLRPGAKADIDEIWTWTARRWSLERAETYVRNLMSEVAALAKSPKKGRLADEYLPGALRRRFRSHEIFYRIDDDGIIVIRVFHYRMDLASRLKDEE